MKINSAVSAVNVIRLKENALINETDLLAAEEPLEIRLIYNTSFGSEEKSIAVTMRTPGNDFELAAGFLFSEGIIKQFNSIKYIKYCHKDDNNNTVIVALNADVDCDVNKLQRNFYISSSCGVCGKSSIAAVATILPEPACINCSISSDMLLSLPEKLNSHQAVFRHTGGLHASALFNECGDLIFIREDIGRHNAVDKIIGAAMAKSLFPLHHFILLLSGRAGFELIQKAAMSEITIVASVGAPSSLAVELAEKSGITLIGFLKKDRFNIYTHHQRIKNEIKS
jgi:FdhD protein